MEEMLLILSNSTGSVAFSSFYGYLLQTVRSISIMFEHHMALLVERDFS
jgi:hypothetical protein